MDPKEAVAQVYRSFAAPFGRRRVRAIPPATVPDSLRRPLQSLFEPVLHAEEREVLDRIEALRSALGRSGEVAEVIGSPAGAFEADGRHLAYTSSVTRTWGAFLHLCAVSTHARTILEFGTSAGFSGCYLASAPTCERFVTVDASPSLSALARRHLGRVTSCAEVITGDANEVLATLAPSLEGSVDLVYLDAYKAREPLLDSVALLAGTMREGGVLVLDDIRFSPEMWQAWEAVGERPDVSVTVDTGRFGVAVWTGGRRPRGHVDLSKHLGWFRVHRSGTARPATPRSS